MLDGHAIDNLSGRVTEVLSGYPDGPCASGSGLYQSFEPPALPEETVWLRLETEDGEATVRLTAPGFAASSLLGHQIKIRHEAYEGYDGLDYRSVQISAASDGRVLFWFGEDQSGPSRPDVSLDQVDPPVILLSGAPGCALKMPCSPNRQYALIYAHTVAGELEQTSIVQGARSEDADWVVANGRFEGSDPSVPSVSSDGPPAQCEAPWGVVRAAAWRVPVLVGDPPTESCASDLDCDSSYDVASSTIADNCLVGAQEGDWFIGRTGDFRVIQMHLSTHDEYAFYDDATGEFSGWYDSLNGAFGGRIPDDIAGFTLADGADDYLSRDPYCSFHTAMP
jgi:hypothetical protein